MLPASGVQKSRMEELCVVRSEDLAFRVRYPYGHTKGKGDLAKCRLSSFVSLVTAP